MNTNNVYKDDVTERSADQQEPKWVLEQRLEALNQVSQLAVPKLEKTNASKWNFTQFQIADKAARIEQRNELPQIVQDHISDENTNLYVQNNQDPLYIHCSNELKQKGVIFTTLADAVREHHELTQKYLFQAFKGNENKVAALHGAHWSGVFLYVPRNVEIKIPLQAFFALVGDNMASFPHLLLVAEQGSRVEIVVNFMDIKGKPSLLNSVIEVFVGEGANVRVATVNATSKSVVDTTYRRGIVQRDGYLEWIVGDFSEGRVISDQTTNLVGEGARVEVKSVALGSGELRSNITTSIRHQARHTTSDIHTRSVVKDAATNILNSITKIEKGASKSDGQQSGKVLMLNSTARGDANPILLIDENDVTAGHAASVGRVDPLQVYYMMSRGVSREEAEKLIVFGFLDTVISEIPSKTLQKKLHGIVERKFRK